MAFIGWPLKATTAMLQAALYTPAKTTSNVSLMVRKHQKAMIKPTTPESIASCRKERALEVSMAWFTTGGPPSRKASAGIPHSSVAMRRITLSVAFRSRLASAVKVTTAQVNSPSMPNREPLNRSLTSSRVSPGGDSVSSSIREGPVSTRRTISIVSPNLVIALAGFSFSASSIRRPCSTGSSARQPSQVTTTNSSLPKCCWNQS